MKSLLLPLSFLPLLSACYIQDQDSEFYNDHRHTPDVRVEHHPRYYRNASPRVQVERHTAPQNNSQLIIRHPEPQPRVQVEAPQPRVEVETPRAVHSVESRPGVRIEEPANRHGHVKKIDNEHLEANTTHGHD